MTGMRRHFGLLAELCFDLTEDRNDLHPLRCYGVEVLDAVERGLERLEQVAVHLAREPARGLGFPGEYLAKLESFLPED